MEQALITQALFLETAGLVLAFLFVLSIIVFVLMRSNPRLMGAWASLKSWLIIAPILMIGLSLPQPVPLILMTLASIFGTKTFFKLTGMYHRTNFLLASYAFIIALGYIIHIKAYHLYNLMPPLFLGFIGLIPLIRNSYKFMIQYLALSLVNFLFMGWALMHMGRMLDLEKGIYVTLYIVILSEFSETISIAGTRYFGKIKLFSKLSPRVTLEGMILSISLTLLLAWAMRHLLPIRSEPYWLLAGFTASIFGRGGDLLMSVIRKDLGIKDNSVFIIGRDDILARLDKLIFVAPIFFYGFHYLKAFGFN